MLELVNTSLPNGLIAGTHGFATVAMTKGLPDALRRRLEALCAYTHKTSAHDASYYSQNPVNWFHAVLPQGEHVVGRVAASDFDYTGRTNRLARLLVFPGREMPAVGGAAILKNETADLSAPWSGDPRYLPADKAKAARLAALQPPAFSSPENWTNLFGPEGALLAQKFAWQLEKSLKGGGKPIYFKSSAAFDQDGTKLLCLFADIIDLLPAELRSSVTFSTYPDALPAGTNCLLRGAFDGDRNFAIASSTQPWVDCEHAKIIHLEMLPSEAAPESKATVSGKKDSLAAQRSIESPAAKPQSIDAPDAAPGQSRSPLRLRQQPSPQHRASSPFLPPPSSNNKKFGIIVAACVVTILALAGGIFVIWQDGEKKKQKAEEQAEMLRQQEADSAQQSAMLENAITNLALVVNQAIGQLEKIKSKIRTTDNPDHFANEELPMEQGKVRDARRAAKSQGVADNILASYDERFDNAVAEVDAAIKNRKMEQEAARKNEEAQAKAEKDKEEAESKPKELAAEMTVQEPTKLEDARPAFCNAREVKVVGINEINDNDFIRRHETMMVFFYSDGDRKDFAVEKVSMKKMGTSHIWSPKPGDVVKKSAGLFTIWYSEKDKTAYWLWNLPKDAEKGDKWFSRDKPSQKDLKQEVFGNSPHVYDFYVDNVGMPTYTIVRFASDSVSETSGVANTMSLSGVLASAELFKPNDADCKRARGALESRLKQAKMGVEQEENDAKSKRGKVIEIEKLYGQLEKATKEYEALVAQKNDKEAAKTAEKNKDKKKKLAEAVDKLKGPIQNKRTERDGLANTLSEQMWRDLGIPANDTSALKRPNVKELQERWEEYKAKIEKLKTLSLDEDPKYKNAKKEFTAAEKALRDFDANFDKLWRKVAEESRYAVTAVKGSKETTTKKGR